MTITVYVEGGGDTSEQQSRCRRGFGKFLEKAGLKHRMPKIVACGSRGNAFSRFKTAVESRKPNALALLLVDSEEAVTVSGPWVHVKKRIGDEWSCPDGAKDEHLHFMVQTMEAWFHCDPEALADYYGKNFRKDALRQNPSVESIPKTDLYSGLEKATRASTKGSYEKGEHSFKILGLIDPQKVRASSQSANRFLTHLESISSR